MENIITIPIGFPTHTIDCNGKTICLGDKCVYNFKGESNGFFIVVFEDNAFRKKWFNWDDSYIKPILENNNEARSMNLMVIPTIKKEAEILKYDVLTSKEVDQILIGLHDMNLSGDIQIQGQKHII